jgi:hypothetical protein
MAAAPSVQLHEFVQSFHPTPNCYFTHHAGNIIVGDICISALARIIFTPSRLSHDSGCNFLSRCQSASHEYLGDSAAGTSVWTNARFESNDFRQFQRIIYCYFAICSDFRFGYCRTGSAGCH